MTCDLNNKSISSEQYIVPYFLTYMFFIAMNRSKLILKISAFIAIGAYCVFIFVSFHLGHFN